MTMRLIHVTPVTPETGNKTIRIYKDTETGEYVCRLMLGVKHHAPADYFTEDYSDARSTALIMLR